MSGALSGGAEVTWPYLVDHRQLLDANWSAHFSVCRIWDGDGEDAH